MAGPRFASALVAVSIGWTTHPASEAVAESQATPVVRAFLDQRDEALASYRGRRYLEARNGRFEKDAWLQVATELGDRGFTYRVIAQGGDDIVRRRVLYPALDAERRLPRDDSRRALTEANYRFREDGSDGDLTRVRITPRRKDQMLVDGWILLSPHDGDLVAVKGTLAKSPSFWTTKVDVVRRYARVAGVRVPVGVESTASVRLAGRSTFSMRYEYDEINGLPVVNGQIARSRSSPTPPRAAPPAPRHPAPPTGNGRASSRARGAPSGSAPSGRR
jgi:hypothetical protein